MQRFRVPLVTALVVAATATGALAGCGRATSAARPASPSTAAEATGPVLARVGPLEVVDAYLPDPASPSVAAVYLTVRNTGASADRLVGVSTPSATSAMLMTEQESGSMGSMAPLRSVTIPAHGEASLAPGHDHAMLEQPSSLTVGQRVPVTLRFARAGAVTVQVPVVPLSAVVDGSPAAPSGSMGAMGTSSGSGG